MLVVGQRGTAFTDNGLDGAFDLVEGGLDTAVLLLEEVEVRVDNRPDSLARLLSCVVA